MRRTLYGEKTEGSMSVSENKWLLLSLAAVLCLAAAIVWMVVSSPPFRLTVLFADIGSLQVGDAVVWKDFQIGRVEKIQPLVENQIGVTIRIKEDYVPSITHGSAFILKRSSFLGLVGRNGVEVVTPSAPGTPYRRGERVQGASETDPSSLQKGIQWTADSFARLKRQSGQLMEEFRNSTYRRDAEEALDELASLAEEGSRQTQDHIEKFRQDHQNEIDAALHKLEVLRDKLRKSGDENRARKVEEDLDRFRSPAEKP